MLNEVVTISQWRPVRWREIQIQIQYGDDLKQLTLRTNGTTLGTTGHRDGDKRGKKAEQPDGRSLVATGNGA